MGEVKEGNFPKPLDLPPWAEPTVLDRLVEVGWPEQGIEDYRRYGHRVAAFYCLLEGPVMTPKGRGTLVQCFSHELCVLLDSEESRAASSPAAEREGPGQGRMRKMERFALKDVKPTGGPGVTRTPSTTKKRAKKRDPSVVTPLFGGTP